MGEIVKPCTIVIESGKVIGLVYPPNTGGMIEAVALPATDYAALVKRAEDAERERDEAVRALTEIAKGEGPYSRDPLTHADNCIDSMKSIATATLSRLPAARGIDAPKEPPHA